MKKIYTISFCFALLISAMQINAQVQKNSVHIHEHNGNFNSGGHHVPGTWTAYIEGDKIYMQLTGENWSNGKSFSLAELSSLPTGNEGSFSLTRDAGTVTFKGIFAGGKGNGFYNFAENPSFKNYLVQKGFKSPDDQLMINIFFTDINKSYFDFLKVNGYGSITNNELSDLAYQDLNSKVMEDYFSMFKTEGYGHQPLATIVKLREHGVDAKFVNSFHQMGYKNISLEQALDLRDHGVSPEGIKEFQAMGYKDITLGKAQELKDHGVNPGFFNMLHQLGYKEVSLDKAQELIDHGVNGAFIKSITALGFKGLSLDKAQELADHGVTASFIEKTRKKGLANVNTLDDYIRLRDMGFKEW